MANIEDVSHLLKVMKQLRDPVKGCAWDLEQDHDSLVPYLEEESQELIEAIESKNSDNIKDELGDVLLQVIFHSQFSFLLSLFLIPYTHIGVRTYLVCWCHHPNTRMS